MKSLFKPSPSRGHLHVVGPKRASKTLAALYRLLREDFERNRPEQCSCKMPMIYEAERGSPADPNWRVEALWCGSIDCQYALTDCVARHARLYDLAQADRSFDGGDAIAGF